LLKHTSREEAARYDKSNHHLTMAVTATAATTPSPKHKILTDPFPQEGNVFENL
jgi:hypothetical protein